MNSSAGLMGIGDLACDVLVVGGGMGGCAAALAAAEAGKSVVLTEPTDWIGGQATQQAVPPDENPWIEAFGANRRYQRFREGVRAWYRQWYPLNRAAMTDIHLNPGGGSVSRICCEPRAALAALEGLLAPCEAMGRLRVLRFHEPVSVRVEGDRVEAVELREARSGVRRTIEAAYVLDATELGDLLPLAGCEYATGFESRNEHGEPHAPDEAQPANMQACTWCFAMDMVDGDATIDKPPNYDFWAAYVPPITPPWPGRFFTFDFSNPRTLAPRRSRLEPPAPGEEVPPGSGCLWRYRQIQTPRIFEPGVWPDRPLPGVTLVNWPQIDYIEGNLFDTPDADKRFHGAKEQALCFFYWLQTEAPRSDGGAGFPGLRMRPDLLGTDDGFAKYPYIRESRRIRARFTVTENHVGVDARGAAPGAERFDDAVGIGFYRIDLHPSTGGDNYIDIGCHPFQIPLGALVPVRLENLLAACKNLGVTHIANGCYRLHPVEWSIGEAAGALAAMCLDKGESPAAIHETAALREELRRRLGADGVRLEWPSNVCAPR